MFQYSSWAAAGVHYALVEKRESNLTVLAMQAYYEPSLNIDTALWRAENVGFRDPSHPMLGGS
jgi:hypothetical protein